MLNRLLLERMQHIAEETRMNDLTWLKSRWEIRPILTDKNSPTLTVTMWPDSYVLAKYDGRESMHDNNEKKHDFQTHDQKL